MNAVLIKNFDKLRKIIRLASWKKRTGSIVRAVNAKQRIREFLRPNKGLSTRYAATNPQGVSAMTVHRTSPRSYTEVPFFSSPCSLIRV